MKKQKTLSNWLQVQQPNMETFFCATETNAFFEKHLPANFCVINTIHIKINQDHFEFYMCTNTKPIFLQAQNVNCRKIELIKSLLQKAVRRQNVQVALSAARDLYFIDPVQLCRRLPIIIMEDTAVYDILPLTIWYSLISTHNPEYVNINAILNIVRCITESNKRTYLQQDNSLKPIHILKEGMNHQHKNLIISCVLRYSYGGMHGDMDMILFLCEQLLNDNVPIYSIEENGSVNVNDIKSTMKTEWILDAIDFHCASQIFKQIANIKKISYDDLKKLTWDNASSINKREKPHIENTEWTSIKGLVSYKQRLYLCSC